MTRIDVCSFGAIGDGTTDDSAAFQAAVDALRHINGAIRLPADQGSSEQETADSSSRTHRSI